MLQIANEKEKGSRIDNQKFRARAFTVMRLRESKIMGGEKKKEMRCSAARLWRSSRYDCSSTSRFAAIITTNKDIVRNVYACMC